VHIDAALQLDNLAATPWSATVMSATACRSKAGHLLELSDVGLGEAMVQNRHQVGKQPPRCS